MSESWKRTHVNGWNTIVEYLPFFGDGGTAGRYAAYAIAPRATMTDAGSYATLELAQKAANAAVDKHTCACPPWRRDDD